MSSSRFPIPQGTLDMLVLQMLSLGPAHGYGIGQRLQHVYFDVLGLRPQLGRLIERSDDRAPDASQVAVVSHQYWKSKLGGAPDVVGRKLLINRHPFTVIGVAPHGL
jgi:hypothetical protein